MTADDTEDRRSIRRRQRHDGDAVERAAGRHHPRGANTSRRRLAAHDIVESGRHPARAGGIGAERERNLAARDHHRRA